MNRISGILFVAAITLSPRLAAGGPAGSAGPASGSTGLERQPPTIVLVFHRPLLRSQPHSAFRVGDFKLVLTWSGPWQVAKRELFNLAKEIGEQQNLAEQMPEKAAELSATLLAYLKSVDAETAFPTTPNRKSLPRAKP